MGQQGGANRGQSHVAVLDRATKIRLLSGSTFWLTRAVDEAGIPAILLTDGPHGVRKQAGDVDHIGLSDSEPATCFPTAVTLASSWDPALLEEVGAALGDEARSKSVGVLLGPGLNIKRHPAGGRNFEYFSEDPFLSGKAAAAMVRGIQSRGVAACPKHFAVNNQEYQRMRVDAVVDERTLREIYLSGFEIVVREADPWAVMSSYNLVNGEHAGESEGLLTGILREQWGFEGTVVSDWYATADRVAGIRAGMDLEMPGSGGTWDREVEGALDSGTLDESRLDEACSRVVDLVARVTGVDGPASPSYELHRPHHELARRAAAAGIVLLTNDGVLPISPDDSIGVVGAFAVTPRFQGSGSSLVNPTRVDDLLDSLQTRALGEGEVRYSPGYDPVSGEATASQFAEAVRVAAEVDVLIVVVGLPAMMESEGWDRRNLSLPAAHDQLVGALSAVNDRTVVVLQNGAPVDLPWAERPAALVEAWLGGQAGGSALADVLLGVSEPGGRLPESFPVAMADLPSDRDFARRPTQVVHREGPYIGYRFHDTFDVAPRFAFGHGLGYTTWSYGEARAIGSGTDLTVIVPVTNTGSRRGSTVVQVYVHDVASTLHRPEHELKGFAKVTLDPGETTEVIVVLDRRSFAVWDVTSSSWLVEAGEYEIRIGASSRDVRAIVEVDIESLDRIMAVPGPVGPVATDEEMAVLLGRPIPEPQPLVPFHRDSTIEDLAETWLGGVLQSIIRRVLARRLAAPDDQMRALAEAVAAQAPLRVLAMNVGGPRALEVLDRLIAVLNAVRLRRGRAP